jgi:hypothetical protein
MSTKAQYQTIPIQRLTTVASIDVVPGGTMPVVEAAFHEMAGLLDERARAGESDALQFTYDGYTFRASVEADHA